MSIKAEKARNETRSISQLRHGSSDDDLHGLQSELLDEKLQGTQGSLSGAADVHSGMLSAVQYVYDAYTGTLTDTQKRFYEKKFVFELKNHSNKRVLKEFEAGKLQFQS